MSLIFVSSSQELDAALLSATGGEEIILAPGDYGDLSMITKGRDDFQFAETVTIRSDDPSNPAVFSSIDVRDAANVTFDGVTFDYEFENGDQIFSRPFNIMSSENVTIRNSTFDGDVAEGVSEADDGYGFAIGLSVRASQGVVLENNEFHTFHRGISVSDSQDIVVTDNEVHSIRMDGMNFAEVQGVVIENNHIHDFAGSLNSTDHRDMIQFWTNGTDEPSTDIVIRGNILDIGEGTFTQSIFMRNDMVDRGLAGYEMFYQNISITDNVILNGHSHGIYVGETDGLVISSNTVLHNDGNDPDGVDQGVEIPVIRVADNSRNVEITQNATSSIEGWTGQSGWQVSQNAFVQDQDPDAAGYYADVFIGSTLQYANGQHSYVADPDGLLHQLNAGASSTLNTGTDAGLEARYDIEQSESGAATRLFEGQYSVTDSGPLPAGTQFEWDFGDGTTATGEAIEHTFATGGVYDVTLVVTLPDGTSDTITSSVEVAGSEILSMSNQGGIWAHENGESQWVSMSDMDADGLNLGQTGVVASIDHDHFASLLHTEEFAFNFSLEAASAASAGEVLRIHNSLLVKVDTKGLLTVTAYKADGGTLVLAGNGVDLSDGKVHDISLSLLDEELELIIAGDVVASGAFEGTLKDLGDRNLEFGNPWGNENFSGTLTNLTITQNASGYAGVSASVPVAGKVIAIADPQQEVTTVEPVMNMLLEDSIQLEDTGVSATVDRELITALTDSDEFTIDMVLGDAVSDTSGEVFRLHGSLLVEVQKNGHLQVRAFTDEGTVRLQSDAPLFENVQQHQISINLEDSVLSLSVDSQPLVAVDLPSGNLAGRGNHDLVFGNPWDRDNFEGEIEAFQITTMTDSGTLTQDLSVLVRQTRDADGQVPASELLTQYGAMTTVQEVEASELESLLTDPDGMVNTSGVIDRFNIDNQSDTALIIDY